MKEERTAPGSSAVSRCITSQEGMLLLRLLTGSSFAWKSLFAVAIGSGERVDEHESH